MTYYVLDLACKSIPMASLDTATYDLYEVKKGKNSM